MGKPVMIEAEYQLTFTAITIYRLRVLVYH